MLFNKIKNNTKTQKDIIYGADEKTRRAIDTLYVTKRERTKLVVSLVVIALFVGFGAGYVTSVSAKSADTGAKTTVTVEASPELKAVPQPEK